MVRSIIMSRELGMGMGFGIGMDPIMFSSNSTTTIATSNSGAAAGLYGLPDPLRIDDLLDFSTTQEGLFDSDAVNGAHNNSIHLLPQTTHVAAGQNCSFQTETATAPANNNSAGSAHLAAFPDDLYLPSDEVAELEWLSKFVEDSFSDMPFPNSGTMGSYGTYSSDVVQSATVAATSNLANFHHHNAAVAANVPGKARSKRSRATGAAAAATHFAAATAWSSLSPSPSSSSSSSSGGGGGGGGGRGVVPENGPRKCTHCSSEKTPQWRTGPLGPKTLCSACGVRYKSGRLVPEYRPASSPTFMLTQHSNSHRKVMELRRQKEILHRHRELSSPSAASTTASPTTATRPDLLLRDYEVC